MQPVFLCSWAITEFALILVGPPELAEAVLGDRSIDDHDLEYSACFGVHWSLRFFLQELLTWSNHTPFFPSIGSWCNNFAVQQGLSHRKGVSHVTAIPRSSVRSPHLSQLLELFSQILLLTVAFSTPATCRRSVVLPNMILHTTTLLRRPAHVQVGHSQPPRRGPMCLFSSFPTFRQPAF